jgi:hypothetical protein
MSARNPSWQAFFDELARWRDAGRTAEFWWRDDDAARPERALSRLIALAQRSATPLALAVIPMHAEKEIFEGIGSFVSILQHGTDHANRAAPDEKKTEFAAAEAPAAAIARLSAARRQLEALAGARFRPVLAPPWNRLPRQLAPHLAAAGFCGISQYGERSSAEASSGLRQVNTHVDIINWHSGRSFAGENDALAAAARHLAAKRTAAADAGEATGWLTHHALHDEAAWTFLERLFETTRERPFIAWRRAEELFHSS